MRRSPREASGRDVLIDDAFDRARADAHIVPTMPLTAHEERPKSVDSGIEISREPESGGVTEEDHAHLPALTSDGQLAAAQVDVAAVEAHQLGESHPGAKEQFDQRPVSQPQSGIDFGSRSQPGHLS